MTVQRTTKPPAHCDIPTSHRVFGLFLAVCLLAGLATANAVTSPGFDDGDIELTLQGFSFAPQWPPDLVIRGTWPDACVPQLRSARLREHQIDIELLHGGQPCAPVPQPFEWRVNPARLSGLDQFPLGIHEVRIFLSGADGVRELVAFRLLRSGGLDTASRPESGFWWSVDAGHGTALGGNGLSIEQQGDRVAVALLSYEAGVPVWFFGSADMPGNIARVPLMRMLGGSEPFSGAAAVPAATPGPALNLHFLGPALARAWLVRPRALTEASIEVETLDLARLPFAEGALDEAWRGEWAMLGDAARSAQVFDFTVSARSDAESFVLRDRNGEIELRCRVDPGAGHPVPSACDLLDGNVPMARFDHNGLDQLSGIDADGQPVRLLRLPR